MKKIGVATVIGVALGVGIASWFDVPNDTAYYAVVGITASVFGAVAALFAKKKS